ncbi:hypothetical protein [Rhizobium bangladeshense]|nr:hypothetical protein [Rhizobium bangladeshense]
MSYNSVTIVDVTPGPVSAGYTRDKMRSSDVARKDLPTTGVRG